jgi:hypothetical protein
LRLPEREARLAVRDKLARNERNEARISRGLTLLLGDPTIASYVLEVYRDDGDAARAVTGFVNDELDPRRMFIDPETIRLKVRAPGHPDIWQSLYISQAQAASITRLQRSRDERYGYGGRTKTADDLPDKIRGAEAIPAVIDAILRQLDDGQSIEQLRKAGVLEIASWGIEVG